MFYRRDLIEHFDWLAESKYLEEFCDQVCRPVWLREEDAMCPCDQGAAR
jgi:hypothetical protein